MVPSQLNSLGGYSSRVDIARVSWLQPMPAIRQRFSCSWLLWERQIKPSSKVSAKKGASRRMLSAMLGWYLDQPRFESRSEQSWEFIFIPVVPARGGAEFALKIYIRPFSSIELACAVRQPSPCVRALCESGVLFHMSHLKLHFALHTSHCTLHTPHCTLHTPHFSLHTALFPIHTSHSTLHTSQSTLHTSHCFLHTPHFTLHTSHCTLPNPHFTLHSSHSTLHLIWALLNLFQLISSHRISSHMSSKLSWITSQYCY